MRPNAMQDVTWNQPRYHVMTGEWDSHVTCNASLVRARGKYGFTKFPWAMHGAPGEAHGQFICVCRECEFENGPVCSC